MHAHEREDLRRDQRHAPGHVHPRRKRKAGAVVFARRPRSPEAFTQSLPTGLKSCSPYAGGAAGSGMTYRKTPARHHDDRADDRRCPGGDRALRELARDGHSWGSLSACWLRRGLRASARLYRHRPAGRQDESERLHTRTCSIGSRSGDKRMLRRLEKHPTDQAAIDFAYLSVRARE